MAIDTPAKRRSAVASRRLPWLRRFPPPPDGTVAQADRQAVAFVYGGIPAAEVVVVAPPLVHLVVEFTWTRPLDLDFDHVRALALDFDHRRDLAVAFGAPA